MVFLFYFGYFWVLYLFHKRAQKKVKSLAFFYPTVSLIVPTFNEEKIISKKIQNIAELDYPNDKMEVIFVDGHSTDQTTNIIRREVEKYKKSVRLISQDRREGYTRAIIDGFSESKGEIIILTDAASYHHLDAIKHLVKHFSNPQIGAVTGKEIILGNNKKIGEELEQSYRFFYDFMRKAETEIDSTPDSKGEILALRRDIFNALAIRLKASPNASFDSCMPYEAKLMGYRTVYDETAKYYEYAPSSFRDRNKQQVRRGTFLVGALLMYRNMIMNRKYGRFGLIILPAHFVMECLLPWLFLLGAGCLLILTLLDPIKTLPFWMIFFVGAIVSKRSRNFLLSFIQSQWALIVAIFRLVSHKGHLYIDTITSTRK